MQLVEYLPRDKHKLAIEALSKTRRHKPKASQKEGHQPLLLTD